MKMQLAHANYEPFTEVEVNTIEDLKGISAEYGLCELVLKFDETPRITLYDDYLE
jgi:hypothetical protein